MSAAAFLSKLAADLRRAALSGKPNKTVRSQQLPPDHHGRSRAIRTRDPRPPRSHPLQAAHRHGLHNRLVAMAMYTSTERCLRPLQKTLTCATVVLDQPAPIWRRISCLSYDCSREQVKEEPLGEGCSPLVSGGGPSLAPFRQGRPPVSPGLLLLHADLGSLDRPRLHTRRTGQRAPHSLHARPCRNALQPGPENKIRSAQRSRKTRKGRHHRHYAKARAGKCPAQQKPPMDPKTRLIKTDTLAL